MLSSSLLLLRYSAFGRLRKFAQQDGGSITALGLVLLMTMLLLGGMAVDFMRYESQRAQLQNIADAAALAAAEKSSNLDPAAVIRDYFRAAGLSTAIVGEPTVTIRGAAKITSVTAQVELETFFLRLAGIETLRTTVSTTALEEVSNVEISLVLDVSGSMRFGGRFTAMQDAAISFARIVLQTRNSGLVSLNIIPYAGQVNVGPAMFAYLNGRSYTLGPDGIAGTADDINFPVYSHCLELTGTDWTTSGLPAAGRAQTPHFQILPMNPASMDWGWCPQDVTAVQYAMTDPAAAESFIRAMRMHAGTGTQYAMKYALALLDPTSQPAFEHLSELTPAIVPATFSDRPTAWNDPQTKKIIVLMTDGEIFQQVRPRFPFDLNNLSQWLGWDPWTPEIIYQQGPSASAAQFQVLCDIAKDPSRNVQVYTVAFRTSELAAQQMRDCASDPSMFFPAGGSELTTVFDNIANRISELRLTQ